MQHHIEKYIDDRKVVIGHLPATAGFRLFTKLTKLVAPVIGAAVGGVSVSGMADILESDAVNLKSAMDALSENLDEDHIDTVIKPLLSVVRIDGQECTGAAFDTLFAGNYGLMMKVTWESINFNFSSFLGSGGLENIMKSLGTAAGDQSQK